MNSASAACSVHAAPRKSSELPMTKGSTQIFGQDQIGEADAGEHHLAEGAEVNHPLSLREPERRGDRTFVASDSLS